MPNPYMRDWDEPNVGTYDLDRYDYGFMIFGVIFLSILIGLIIRAF